MQENIWYPGEISIIDAENYPPVGNKFFEPIKLNQKYYLHVGIDVIGRCELEEITEVSN